MTWTGARVPRVLRDVLGTLPPDWLRGPVWWTPLRRALLRTGSVGACDPGWRVSAEVRPVCSGAGWSIRISRMPANAVGRWARRWRRRAV